MIKGLTNRARWKRGQNLFMVSALLLAANNWATPSPVEDEDFLLFLADTVEEGSGLIDPLSMTDKDQFFSVKIMTETQTQMTKTEQEDENVK